MSKKNKIKELTRKNPTLQKVFLEIFESNPDSDYNIIKDTYEEYKKYQNLLKNNQFDIKSFREKTFEDIYDEISRQAIVSEKRKYALSFISKKYAHLLNDEGYDLFYSIKEMNLSHEKVNDLVVKKIARYKTPEDFNDTMQSFIEGSRNHEISSIVKKINDSNVNAKIIKEDHEKNILLVEIKDFEASKHLGSKSWCISTRKSYFDTYLSRGGAPLNNKQYFLWDFNLSPNNKESMVGFTLNMGAGIEASHYKNDSSISAKALNNILKKHDAVISQVYNKKEIIEALKESKAPSKEKIELMLKCVDDKNEVSDIFESIVYKKRMTDYDWKNIVKSNKIKSPEVLFNLLEDQYSNIKEKSLSKGVYYNNFKSAINALFETSMRSGYHQEPIYLKYYWEKENVEKLFSEKWMRPVRESSKVFLNHLNVDLLGFYKRFKNDETDYISKEEKKSVIKHIIKRYQHSVGENSLEKFKEWDKDVLNDKDTVLALGYMHADDLQKINRITEIANWDDDNIRHIFSKKAVIEKVIRNKDQLLELNDVQIDAIKNNIDITIKSFSDLSVLNDLGVVNEDLIKNNFQTILKDLLDEDINNLKSFYRIVESYGAESPINRKIIEKALNSDEKYEKCQLMLEKSSDDKNVCDFMLECRNLIQDDNEKSKVLNVLSNILIEEEKTLNVLNKINLKTYQPITKTFIPEVLNHLDINKAFVENDDVKKLLVKMLNKGEPNAVSSLMGRLNDSNQNALIMMSEKGKDPLVKFLMNKISDKEPDNTKKSGLKIKPS